MGTRPYYRPVGIAENRPLGSQNDTMRVARKGYAWKPRRGFEKEDQTKHDKIVGGAEVLYGKAYRLCVTSNGMAQPSLLTGSGGVLSVSEGGGVVPRGSSSRASPGMWAANAALHCAVPLHFR